MIFIGHFDMPSLLMVKYIYMVWILFCGRLLYLCLNTIDNLAMHVFSLTTEKRCHTYLTVLSSDESLTCHLISLPTITTQNRYLHHMLSKNLFLDVLYFKLAIAESTK